jgi:hypothetical protein
MKRILRAVLRYLPKVDRTPAQAEKELQLGWNGKPVEEVVQPSPSACDYETLHVPETGSTDGISPRRK